MPTLKFLEYAPDVSDVNESYTARMRNVIPRLDGYGPVNDLAAFTSALGAVCRGYFEAKAGDGTVVIFAATATRLYKLNNTTFAWADVSKGATDYTTVSPDANWTFCQFNNYVVATQKNVVMQYYDITVSTAFADLGGSPPQAGWIGVIGQFLVAADLLSNPNRLAWSGISAPSFWTAGQQSSDDDDMPDGGRVRCVAEIGNNVGLICQDNMLRRMTFAPGSAEVFQIDKLVTDRGILAQWSLQVAGGIAYMLSTKGFVAVAPNGQVSTIGEERVDRTFLGQHDTSVSDDILALAYDSGQPQLVIGVADPTRNLLLWVYKSQAGISGLFDSALIYHTTLKRWAPAELSGEYIAPLAKPGLTLEALDAIAPGAQTITGAANNGSGLIRLLVGSTSGFTTGDYKTISGVTGTTEANGLFAITVIDATHIDLQGSAFVHAYVSGGVVGGSLDLLAFSLDSLASSSLPAVSGMTASHALGFFTGATLEAELYTAEQSASGPRMEINGLTPLTDATNVYGSVVSRETLDGDETEGAEAIKNEDGDCPVLEDARYARAKLRIIAGEHWTFAKGVIPVAGTGSAY